MLNIFEVVDKNLCFPQKQSEQNVACSSKKQKEKGNSYKSPTEKYAIHISNLLGKKTKNLIVKTWNNLIDRK